MEFPANLYMTPDDWGSDTLLLTADELEQIVKDLTDSFQNPVYKSECQSFGFEKLCSEKTALYTYNLPHIFQEIDAVLVKIEAGGFEIVKCFNGYKDGDENEE